MKTLEIDSATQVDARLDIEVDPYLPIAVRTYTAPLGAVFYRVGNFETSLIEIGIDPSTRVVRGVKAVSLDRVGKVFEWNNLPRRQGLPVVAEAALPADRVDDLREICANLSGSVLVLDWSQGEPPQYLVEHAELAFAVGDRGLIGAVISGLSEEQQALLKEHLPT